jgi:hypothetical protein
VNPRRTNAERCRQRLARLPGALYRGWPSPVRKERTMTETEGDLLAATDLDDEPEEDDEDGEVDEDD